MNRAIVSATTAAVAAEQIGLRVLATDPSARPDGPRLRLSGLATDAESTDLEHVIVDLLAGADSLAAADLTGTGVAQFSVDLGANPADPELGDGAGDDVVDSSGLTPGMITLDVL